VFPWQAILAYLLGGSIWLVKLAHLFNDSKVRVKYAVEQRKK
jgi:hypothetical protein